MSERERKKEHRDADPAAETNFQKQTLINIVSHQFKKRNSCSELLFKMYKSAHICIL